MKAASPARSARPDIRNPVLALPEARELADLLAENPEVRDRAIELLGALSRAAHAQADKSWRQRKAPLAAYWRAWGRELEAPAARASPHGLTGSVYLRQVPVTAGW